MKNLNFYYKDSALINNDILNKYSKEINNEINLINKELLKGYDSSYAFLNLYTDNKLIEDIEYHTQIAKDLNPDIFLLIGIGGSNLATLALFNGLYGNFYNLKSKLLFFYADTIDQDYTQDLYLILEKNLKENKKILINIVTKSGTTTETIVNSAIFITLLKKYVKNYNKYIFITTDKDSKLYNIAIKENYNILQIPKYVGGRFSVFSAVSLFPINFLYQNINLKNLMSYLKEKKGEYTNKKIEDNYAAISAIVNYFYYQNNIKISDIFIFTPNLANIGAWYRQLFAESLGKKYDKFGNIRHIGITPTVSIGTTDLHSMAQLYLAGPKDKITTFLYFKEDNLKGIKIKKDNFTDYFKNLENLTLSKIKSSILNGVKDAYIKNQRPFMTIELLNKDIYSIADFLIFKMIETLYLGRLFNINVFDQPAVELYKEETRKYLKI